ncbi:S9 family peptidase [Bacillus sp. RAR_GA_16]|uniref:S9 family peptidase n=1 Tax=Bacillus sp. RAR_GA_16 TaxID=2876774 RepID=UPI001CCD9917|nr:prolyl oligopeptidase family serine peptidase [Bacillus sp. RAR_GA_16]MCA0173041.1 prolyl oligopeptidase family serine peptidase [Bacillus sp. RAR_GA_16]
MLHFHKPDVEQFFQTLDITDFVISPDEKQLVVTTNMNGHFNLWGMDLPNMYPYPMTFRNQRSHVLHYDQKGEFLIAGFDQDGDENIQLYALQPRGGSLLPIRVEEGEKHYFSSLSEDGKRLYYTSSKGNPTYLNGYCYNLETEEVTMLIEGSEAPIEIIAVSEDEENFIYTKHYSNTHTPVFVRSHGEDLSLTPASEKEFMVYEAIFVTADSVYFTTNFESNFSYLAKFNLHTKHFSKVLEIEHEDLTSFKADKENNRLYLVSKSGVEDRLFVYDLSREAYDLKKIPVNLIDKLAISEKGNLYVLGDGSTSPANIYFQRQDGEEWEKLTNNVVPGISEELLIEPEVIRYPSYDGLEIEGLFYRADEENSNGHVIHWPHGGPQSAERKMYWSLYQFLLHRGYSIFAPNFRGSTGYGLEFMKMVEQDWGFGPRLDNVKGIEWLIANDYVDSNKVLLMGGSYGGYMALLLHGRHAEYYKAVVDIFGPGNLFSFIDSVPDHWKPSMAKFVGDPVEHKDKLTEDSPITYLKGMKKPMLVVQGANDPRVVKAESDQIVEALKKEGAQVEYMVLEDEGHGFSKKENEIKVYRKILHFLDQQLVR